MSPVAPLFDGVRRHGATLLAQAEEPAAELLALVWGAQFDREHARGLLQRAPQLQPEALRSVLQAADLFDRLPWARQQRIRRLILRVDARRGLHGAGATMPA